MRRSGLEGKIKKIISGGAPGADQLAERYAHEHRIKFKEYPANWDLLGKSAGPVRNAELADACDVSVSLWDSNSPGTRGFIDLMRDREKPHFIYWITSEGQPFGNADWCFYPNNWPEDWDERLEEHVEQSLSKMRKR